MTRGRTAYVVVVHSGHTGIRATTVHGHFYDLARANAARALMQDIPGGIFATVHAVQAPTRKRAREIHGAP